MAEQGQFTCDDYNNYLYATTVGGYATAFGTPSWSRPGWCCSYCGGVGRRDSNRCDGCGAPRRSLK